MSQAILHVTDAYVSKGYNNVPQTKFTGKEGSDYGSLTFKISIKKSNTKAGEKAEYDKYSITWKNVKAQSKVIDLLNTPGVKVSVYGELTQEMFETTKFLRITCEGRNAVVISTFGSANNDAPVAEAPDSPGSDSDDQL